MCACGQMVTMLVLVCLLFHSGHAARLVLEEAQAMALGRVRGARKEHMRTLFSALHTHHVGLLVRARTCLASEGEQNVAEELVCPVR